MATSGCRLADLRGRIDLHRRHPDLALVCYREAYLVLSCAGAIHPRVEAGGYRLIIEIPDRRLRIDLAPAVARRHAEEVNLPVAVSTVQRSQGRGWQRPGGLAGSWIGALTAVTV